MKSPIKQAKTLTLKMYTQKISYETTMNEKLGWGYLAQKYSPVKFFFKKYGVFLTFYFFAEKYSEANGHFHKKET